jgi:hypothetical protein
MMTPPADDGSRVTYLISLPVGSTCPVVGCPRQQVLARAIRDAITTLERTRSAFKSKQLGSLRQRLERVLEDEVAGK